MIDSLQKEFGIPGAVEICTGVNDLPKVVLTHKSGSKAEVYLHGGHVTSWTDSHGEELFFVSSSSQFAPMQPIRGGIPIIFPQFGGGPLPAHGFARTCDWELIDTSLLESGEVLLVLQLNDSDETRKMWNHAFSFRLSIVLDVNSLRVSETVANTGIESFDFQTVLHTYFGVQDIRETEVRGLKDVSFIDTKNEGRREIETRALIDFAGETDRIYVKAPDLIQMHDRQSSRIISLRKDNLTDVVVWNPWIEKAHRLSDFGDDEYLRMVCIETGCIEPHINLSPGDSWMGETVFTVSS